MDNRRTAASLQGAGAGQSQSASQNQANLASQQYIGSQPQNPGNNLTNIAKINARLRARNPAVVNSMQAAGSPQLLMPLSQRSFSPPSSQVIQPQNQQSPSGAQ